MATFVFTPLADMAKVESGCLGASAGAPFKDIDRGKPVKKGVLQNFVLCANTNEIEGFVQSVENATRNSGFSYGGVQTHGRVYAKVGAVAVALLDLVVAGVNPALGTALDGVAAAGSVDMEAKGLPVVITGTPATFKWRCIRFVVGTGQPGETILIERV